MKTKAIFTLLMALASGFFFLGVSGLNANDGSGWYETKDCAQVFPTMCPDGGGCSVRKDLYVAIQCKIHCSFSDGFQDKHYILSCYDHSEAVAFWSMVGGALRDIFVGFWNFIAR